MPRKLRAYAVVLAVVAIWLIGGPAPAAGQITGSGTPGKVPKWTGSMTQGDSIIVESSGLIGIDTSTPTVKLDVNGRLKTKGNIDTGAHYKIRGTQALGVDAILQNTAIGVNALLMNTTGHSNTAIGDSALVSNTTSYGSTAIGFGALRSNTTGSGPGGWSDNTATGVEALANNTTGHSNTATGVGALRNNTTGWDNTAVGAAALEFNTTGNWNTAIGVEALRFNTIAINNTAVGNMALQNTTTGGANTATGFGALQNNTTGTDNTAVGNDALQSNTIGSSNIALGSAAGALITGNSNIAIGHPGVAGDSATIRIGSSSQARTFIAGISGLGVPGGVGVLVSSSGQLGTSLSSRRVKEEIRDMGESSQGLSRLRPVTFRYTQALADGSRALQYGLIAEEVAEVYPELVAYDPTTGEPQTVLYHVLPALLLNELQRQQRQLEARATQMEANAAELAALRARLAILEAAGLAAHRAASTPNVLNGD